MSGRNIYDLTPEQREVALWRDAKRRQLRELYLKDSGHPTKSLLFDTGIYRYAAARASISKFFVPRAVDFFLQWGTILVAIGLTYTMIRKSKTEQEHKYRTGQVKYADRQFKFV